MGLERGRGSPNVYRELTYRPGSASTCSLDFQPEALIFITLGTEDLPSVPNFAEDLKTWELAGEWFLTSCLWVVAIPEAAANAF